MASSKRLNTMPCQLDCKWPKIYESADGQLARLVRIESFSHWIIPTLANIELIASLTGTQGHRDSARQGLSEGRCSHSRYCSLKPL